MKPSSPPASAGYRGRRGWSILLLFLASSLTWALSLPLFEPLSWWPFAFVVYVPWLVAMSRLDRPGWLCTASYWLGAIFFLTHLRWLYATTPEGYVAASLYLAAYVPLAAWVLGHLHHRRGVPMVIGFPLVWVAVELLRSRGPLAFPWFLLGHSQIRFPSMIQIADLAGVAGISFVLAMVNGLLADTIARVLHLWASGSGPHPQTRVGLAFRIWIWAHRLGQARRWQPTLVVVLVLAATLVYGRYRLGFTGQTPGPKLAVVQGDFLLAAVRGANGASDSEKALTYVTLMAEAAGTSPDMIVLPETPWSMVLNPEAIEAYPEWAGFSEIFEKRARQFDTYITVGGMSEVPQPPGAYPAEHRYNSAFVYTPGESRPQRYDKIHLVPFGEYVPFRYTKSLFWLYRFLNDSYFNPWGRGGVEYSLTPGKQHTVLTMQARSQQNREYHFGATICYEDVIPQVFRRFVADRQGRKLVDFMVNISNDGWFGHGNQQAQHLVNCAFRGVENRVAVARAANTGTSGFVDSSGSWHDLVGPNDDKPQAGGTGYRTAQITIDPRVTLYSRYGDVFAFICTGLMLAAGADAIILRRRQRRQVRVSVQEARSS